MPLMHCVTKKIYQEKKKTYLGYQQQCSVSECVRSTSFVYVVLSVYFAFSGVH
jgi:hypothetical protein